MKNKIINKKNELILNEELKDLINEYNQFNSNFREKYYHLVNQFELLIKRPKSSKEKDLLRKQLTMTTEMLRSVQLDAECELDGERLITLFDSTLGNNKQEDDDWEMYFNLLKEFMTENNHCYFEKGQKYKNKNLGDWVISQRKLINNKNADPIKITRLLQIKILDKNILNWARDKDDRFLAEVNYLLKNKSNELDNQQIADLEEAVNEADLADHLLGDIIPVDSGLLDAHVIDPYINFTCWVWSNQDASWLRYYKELKRYYILNRHSVVPANYTNNDINLGTWVLRMRQEYKKDLLGELTVIPSNPRNLNRHHLLWNLYFIRETDLTKALQSADDAIDVIDVGERASMEEKYETIKIGEIND